MNDYSRFLENLPVTVPDESAIVDICLSHPLLLFNIEMEELRDGTVEEPIIYAFDKFGRIIFSIPASSSAPGLPFGLDPRAAASNGVPSQVIDGLQKRFQFVHAAGGPGLRSREMVSREDIEPDLRTILGLARML